MRNQSLSMWHPQPVGIGILFGLVLFVAVIGCRSANKGMESTDYQFQDYLSQIEYPEIDQQTFESAQESLSARPPSVSKYEDLEFQDITLEEAIQMALSNSKVLSGLGGQVINNPNAITSFDPAIQESSLGGVERALSAFDARWDTTFNFNRSERKFNNIVQSSFSGATSNNSDFFSGISKQTTFGSTFGVSNTINYRRFDSPVNRFNSSYDMLVRAEYRQALLRGAGSMVNQVAGPNSNPGVYNGVLIARIGQDVTLADFETAVRDLVRDVESSYWELYYAYRNLDNLIEARDEAGKAWERRENRRKVGVESPDVEPQARQQYWNFQRQVQDALGGNAIQSGLYGAERRLRRLIGVAAGGATVLRPTTDPLIAKAEYDWDNLQIGAMEKRVELRRQQWIVKQRELEYLAAQNLNRWQLDFVANYGWRGFGDNLVGSTTRPEGSALEDLFSGELDDWNMGFEFGGPIGKRQTFVAVRNAELQLAKARAVLNEQQRQVVFNLNEAFVEVDRTYESIRANYNAWDSIKDELRPKLEREKADAFENEDYFFLREALQRAANTRSLFVRAIADYNIALVNVAYESGQLLQRYNIQVAEGPWVEDAYQNAAARNLKFSR